VDYGEIVGSAWRMTWRNRGLWWVGFFAGGASGSCSGGSSVNSGMPAGQGTDAFPGFDRNLESGLASIQSGLAEILPILIVLGIIIFVIWLGFWLLSVACAAAVIVGGREAAAGRPATLSQAWTQGLRAYGRLFQLELLWLVFWIVIIGLIVLLAIQSLTNQPRSGIDWLFWVLNLFGVLAVVGIVGSLLSIVLAYAQRAIVLDGAGAVDGISAGARLARQRLGQSLLVWLIGLALSIGGGIVLVIGLIVLALPTVLIGAILGILTSLTGGPGFGVGLGLLFLVLFVAVLVGGAGLNTYLWHYWTLAYLHMTGALAPAAAPVPPAPEPVAEPS